MLFVTRRALDLCLVATRRLLLLPPMLLLAPGRRTGLTLERPPALQEKPRADEDDGDIERAEGPEDT